MKRFIITLISAIALILAMAMPASAHGRHIAVVGMPGGFSMPAVLHDWSQGSNVHLYAKPNCVAQRHCIRVSAFPMRNGMAGYTKWERYSNGTSRAWVSLNSRVSNGHVRHQTACHEIGHALYLQHNGVECMKNPIRGTNKKPGAYNLQRAR